MLSEVDKPVSDMGRASSVTLRVASFHSLVNVWPTMTNHLNPLQSIISGQLNLPSLIGSNVPFWVQCSILSTIPLHDKSFPQHLSLQSPNPFMSNIFSNSSFYSLQNTIPPHHISVPNMSSTLHVPCYLMGFQTLLIGCSNPLIRFNSTSFKMK